MKWLLDTNACIRYLNGRSPGLRERLDSKNDSDITVCSIVKAELAFGAMRSRDPQHALRSQAVFVSRFHSYAFDDRCAEVYGFIRAELAGGGLTIGPNDMLIAAIAVAHGLSLVTHKVAEFSRVHGLVWEDWEVE